jgi:predicted RNase H-like HicB family nuclease
MGMRAERKVKARFLLRGKWWVAWTDDVPGALTQGRILEEARENLKDAIALMRKPADRSILPKAEARLVEEVLTL